MSLAITATVWLSIESRINYRFNVYRKVAPSRAG